jgi:hypothetical protein
VSTGAGVDQSGETNGVPTIVVRAAVNAAQHPEVSCGIGWSDILAISGNETRWGTFTALRGVTPQTLANGDVVQAGGGQEYGTRWALYGPLLNGSGAGGNRTYFARRGADEWATQNGERAQRAYGINGFLPSVWRTHGADGNGDGLENPHNVFDAAVGTAKLLCANGYAQDRGTAIRRYNGSGPNAFRYRVNALLRSAEYEREINPGSVGAVPSFAAAGVTTSSGGVSAVPGWWAQVGAGSIWERPTGLISSWLAFVIPGGSGGSSVAAVNGSWPHGSVIERGRPDPGLCRAAYRAAADDTYCWPGGSAHPAMTLDLARAIRVWLRNDGAPGNRIGMWRSADIPGTSTGRASRSDHKSGLGLDVGLVGAAGGSVARLDRLQAVLCRYADGSAGFDPCRLGAPPGQGSCSSPIERLVWRGAVGHSDHIHISVCNNADPARMARLIAELGGTGPQDDDWEPYRQYGSPRPEHVGPEAGGR